MREDTDTKTVTVFPLACGIGKSEYIRYTIADALENNYGLIIVTDSIDRLNGYINSEQDHQLLTYIDRNKDRISVLDSKNISDEIKTISYKPVLLMSTQRYFNLTKKDILIFTSGQQYERDRIIFDEKVYLLQERKITVESLDEISTAFKVALDNMVNQDEKQWLITQYDNFNTALQQRIVENENQNNNIQSYKRELYFEPNGLTISEDDVKFNKLVEKYKQHLNKYNADIVKNIEAINKLLVDGVITSKKAANAKSRNEYDNYFTVIINNIDKLIDIGAKVFVLDGTADISPEYTLNCVNMVDCSRFNRNLNKLTVNIVDVNTSKTRLTEKGNKTASLIHTIIDYIKAQPLNIDTVFTYKTISKKFTDNFANVNHFGNIKGSNQYREITNIFQVGLNRYSDLIHMLIANEIAQYNYPDKSFNHRIYDKETIDNIRCRLIMADFEQNLFRCKIRNIDNTEPCTYTLMCNVSEKNRLFEDYQPLVDMIKARYEPLGATINIIETPMPFKLLKTNERNTKNKTSIQKFNDWYKKQPSGRIFKRADILSECNLSISQFKDVKNSGILNTLKSDKQGIYIIK